MPAQKSNTFFHLHSIKDFLKRYERHLSSLALLLGFIIDSLTLRRVDLFIENAVIVGYLLVSAFCIIVLNLKRENKEFLFHRFLQKVRPWVLILMQFAFGGLFSAFLVFYSRSASFASSWPFLLVLFIHLVGNEVLKKQYTRTNLQISIFFIALFSYSIFLLPVLFGKIGAFMFIFSGLFSLVLIALFLFILRLLASYNKRLLFWSIGGIFCVMNFLYFINAIPPIPLSLKEAGVYHSLTRNSKGEYFLEHEKTHFLDYFRSVKTIHRKAGEPLYAFSAIFAPTRIQTDIFHKWEYYDEKKEKWVSDSRIKLPIIGGREGGYRTYSSRANLSSDLWRVSIETERGQLIGRIKFKLEDATTTPPLFTKVR